MRFLVTPDKFKGTLTAPQAAEAIARGVSRAAESRGVAVEIDLCPIADGGEGTAAIVETALRDAGASIVETRAEDLLSAPVTARIVRWKNADGAYTALIESAQVIGLDRVPEHKRNPERLTTSALGTLIDRVRTDDTDELVVGLGGSATVDGGLGATRALGWRAEDARGRAIESLADLARVSRLAPPREPFTARVTVLCDVDNPLLGARGAARVYGPQKGATPEQVERLEQGLARLVELCRGAGIACDPEAPGAGAAGGLGFGLAAFLGAELVPGAPYLLDLIGFGARAARADLVITGEGRLDAQTASRKAPMEAARIARSIGRPVLAVVGSAEPGAPRDAFDGVAECLPEGGGPAERLAAAANEAVGAWIDTRCSPPGA